MRQCSLVAAEGGRQLFRIEIVAPFIGKSTWPGECRRTCTGLTTRPGSIQAHYTLADHDQRRGLSLLLEAYAGSGTLMIDGVKRDVYARNRAAEPGMHHLEVQAQFAPMAWEPVIRLIWAGPIPIGARS